MTLGSTINISDCQVCFFISNGNWNIEKLLEWYPNFPTSKLNPRLLEPQANCPDSMIWRLTSTGEFSFKSAYNLVRPKKPISLIDGKIWHSALPQKISFFMSNMWRSKIPIEENLSRLQIAGPTVCDCYFLASEIIDHVFGSGPRAAYVWNFFQTSLGLVNVPLSLKVKCIFWWNLKFENPLMLLCYQLIPSLICWSLWKARNNWKFESIKLSIPTIIANIL